MVDLMRERLSRRREWAGLPISLRSLKRLFERCDTYQGILPIVQRRTGLTQFVAVLIPAAASPGILRPLGVHSVSRPLREKFFGVSAADEIPLSLHDFKQLNAGQGWHRGSGYAAPS